MEISPFQSIESQMRPKADRSFSSTSFTGLPEELIETVRAEADRSDRYLYEIFREAIDGLVSRIGKEGCARTYNWPLARPKIGTIPYNARMDADTVKALRDASDHYGVKKNIFFMAALRDYLRKSGIEIDI